MALWGGRFEGESDPLFTAINDSLPVDHRLVQEDIEGSIAWAEALEGAGVLTADESSSLRAALAAIAAEAKDDPAAVRDAGDEDVHSWVESRLIARVGDLGKKLHTGRSRNDQVATDLRLWTRRAIAARQAEIAEVRAALVRLAERQEGTVLPGYTHLQRAQPVLFSHWCLAYFEMLERDAGRLDDAARRAGQCPLGAGALAGTAYPIDRFALAQKLGFDAPTANSLDAVSDRDFVVETLAAASLCGVHLSRLAEDLVFFGSEEAGFVTLSDAVTSGSSLMPQKKNPDAIELVRGKSGRLIGALVSMSVTLKGLPLAYNKDMQEDKETLFGAMDDLSLCLRVLPRVLDGLLVHADVTRHAAESSYANATELADYLVGRGVPFRDAHDATGKIVRSAIDRKLPLLEMPIDAMQAIEPRVDEGVRVHLTIDATLRKRDVYGGTAPDRVRAAIQQAREADVDVRQASMDDVPEICRLVDYWYEQGENLPRSRDDVVQTIHDFGVAVDGASVVGCGSLHMYSSSLAEIRSLGVDPACHGRGVGSELVRYLLDAADRLHVPKVFVLTRAPEFFRRLGFASASMESLPEKIWKDCATCPKQECCDEIPMVYEVARAHP